MSFYKSLEEGLYLSTVGALALAGHSDVICFFADDNILEPDKTYCVLNVIDIEQVGRVTEETLMTGPTPKLSNVVFNTILVQYSIIGKDARSVAPVLSNTIGNSRSSFMLFESNKLGIMEKSKIRNIPQKRETQWVPCFNFDLKLSFSLNSKEEMNWIDYVKVNNNWFRTNQNLPPI